MSDTYDWTCRICGAANSVARSAGHRPTCSCGERLFLPPGEEARRRHAALPAPPAPEPPPPLHEFTCDGCGEAQSREAAPLVFEPDSGRVTYCGPACKQAHVESMTAAFHAAKETP